MAEELLTKEFTTELSEEEKETVNEYVSNIDINDSQMVLQYGAGVQKEIANFSEAALGSVKNQDLGEIGELLTGVVTELKDFDATEEKGGFLGIFKKAGNRMTAIKAKYDKAEKNINNIVKVMEGHQVTLMKDIAMLDQMYETNLKYFKELSLYIVAGKETLKEAREVELPKLLANSWRIMFFVSPIILSESSTGTTAIP